MSSRQEDTNTRPAFEEFAPSSYETWKEAAVAALKGAPFEKRMFTPTCEGITLSPLYTAEDTKDLRAARTFPGSYSLRGSSASGNLGKPWEIAQFCEGASPSEVHRAIIHELERGATTVAFRADAVPLSSLEDANALLNGLLGHPLYVYAGPSSAPVLGLIEAQAARENFDIRKLKGCVGADPLGSLLEKGDLPASLDELWDEMAATIRWADEKNTPLRTILIRGTVAHNGGASAVQEAACAMTAAIETLRAMTVRGVTVGEFARRLRFDFSQGANFFMEIAKLRAARQVWSRIAGSFGGDDAAEKSEIFARTSSFTKTVYDPCVNMLRNTTEAFSAVVGGAEGLTVVPFDEPLRPSSEFSRRVSRNAQIMLQKEFNLLEPIDPAGGSWYLEKLTDELAHKIWAELQKIEGQGGFLQSVRDGLIQKDIDAVLQGRFKNLARRSDRAVGTNMYPNMSEPAPEFGSPEQPSENSGHAAAQSRDEAGLKKKLDALDASRDGLVTKIAGAAAAGAVINEVRDALNKNNRNGESGGELHVTPVRARRWTEQFEALRRRTEEYRARTGDNVKIFLANMGPIPQHKARADFITGFMEVAAFDVLHNDGFGTTDECADAAAKSGALAAVICSTDATYPELVPPLAKAIKEKNPGMRVCLAGEPAPEFKESYEQAGVDAFISVRSNCLEVLTELQKLKGME